MINVSKAWLYRKVKHFQFVYSLMIFIQRRFKSDKIIQNTMDFTSGKFSGLIRCSVRLKLARRNTLYEMDRNITPSYTSDKFISNVIIHLDMQQGTFKKCS